MGFLGFRWGSFPHFFSKKCWSRFFFSVGFMVDFRGHTGRWHSQWSLGWWTTKHWKGFPNCSWSEQGFLQLFFFFFLRRWSIVLWLGYPETDGSSKLGDAEISESTAGSALHPDDFPEAFREQAKQTLSVSGGMSLSWASKSLLGICRASLGVLHMCVYIYI